MVRFLRLSGKGPACGEILVAFTILSPCSPLSCTLLSARCLWRWPSLSPFHDLVFFSRMKFPTFLKILSNVFVIFVKHLQNHIRVSKCVGSPLVLYLNKWLHLNVVYCFQKAPSSPRPTEVGGLIQSSTPADKHTVRSYGRKKASSKSQLKSKLNWRLILVPSDTSAVTLVGLESRTRTRPKPEF